ncbi:MAG: tRNA lysidine(34) synthetase TilS [Cyanobacteria bacterium J06627_28]
MVWSLAHAKLHTLLRQRRLLPKHSHILMAVSGGQDSLCLARLLMDLQSKWHWQLGLVHCDHGWRPDSAKNAKHVMALAKAWGVQGWQESAIAPPNSEAAARDWRYQTFTKIARAQGYGYVVTGHTMSDRAETVLYNLIRGTGTDGIGTLPWVRPLVKPPLVSKQIVSKQIVSKQNIDTHLGEPAASNIYLVRPLLNMTRQETSEFCQAHQLPIWEDSSNQDLTFRRNRIRQELMPYLQKQFNPKAEQALAQLAEIAAAETEYLSAQTNALFEKSVVRKGEDCWEIECDRMNQAPLALQRRVIKQALENATLHPPSFLHIKNLSALLSAPNGSQSAPFPDGWSASVQKPHILLIRKPLHKNPPDTSPP